MNTLRSQLNDNDFTVSKLYGFRSKFAKTYYSSLSIDDFVIPDFNVSVKVKSKKDEVVDDVHKKIFEASFYVLDNKTNTSQTTITPSKDQRIKTLKNTTPEKIEEQLGGQYIFLKKLVEKVNLKSLRYAYKNFFLYDLENIIKPTFTTELQKEFAIYGLINFSGEVKKKVKFNFTTKTFKT